MIWPFKPKAPRLSMEEYAAQQPPAPCGQQTTHYSWEHFESMTCPACASKQKAEREAVERGLLAICIVNEMQKRGLIIASDARGVSAYPSACNKPTQGWLCSRTKGHDGECDHTATGGVREDGNG